MSADVFSVKDLQEIANLMEKVEEFNRLQALEEKRGMFAEVTIFRGGVPVAELTEAIIFGNASPGELAFNVLEDKK